MRTVCFIRQTEICNDSRATKTIETLSRRYNVIVLGWNRSGDAPEKSKGLFPSNVTFRFYNKKLPHGSGLKGLGKLVGFIRWVKKQVQEIGNKIDFIHACDLDGAIGCYKYAQKKRIPLIYDIYDYYIDAHSIPKVFKNKIERKEIEIINGAFATIICSEGRTGQIGKAKPKQLCIIHNSPAKAMIDPDPITLESDGNVVNIVYVGILSDNRLIREIVDETAHHPNVRLTVGGNGELSTKLSGLSLNNFVYVGEMIYKDVLKLESKADVLFATYDPTVPNHKYSAPNKLYEAMALGKPIIVCKGTGVDKIVVDENIGTAIGYSASEFFEVIEKICKEKNRYKAMSERAKYLFDTKFCWEVMEERLFAIYAQAEDFTN